MTDASLGPRKGLHLQPISLREARVFVTRHHRHHRAPQGGLFALAVNDGAKVVAVAIVGRPVSRHLQDGYTAEVTRLCALDDQPNACSKLYAAAKHAAQALGYVRVITYTLASESGASLRGAGWKNIGRAGGGSWSRPSRPRVDTAPLEQKQLWEAVA
jgi:hypothetical protein